MSRDQKPGKVRNVSITPERRQAEGGVQTSQTASAPAENAPINGIEQPKAKGISVLIMALCLVCGVGGGAAIVALAPMLGLI